jgi:hypothetical protein
VAAQYEITASDDIISALQFAFALQSKIFVYFPAVLGIFFILDFGAFVLYKRQLRSTSNTKGVERRAQWKKYTVSLLGTSVLFLLPSAVGLTQVSGSSLHQGVRNLGFAGVCFC